jgi:purine catabolism regulator
MPETNSRPVLGSESKSALTMRSVLHLPALQGAKLVAGEAGLDRPVLWSHVVDMPDPAPWVPPGYFLLTTGLSWPQQAHDRGALIEALAARGLAGVGLAVPRYVSEFTQAERAAADRAFLPLIEIPFEIPFARITEELHHAIVAEPYRVIERSEQIHHALMQAASRDATLDDLARTLCPLVGRTVTFEDANGSLLAHCSVDAKPPTAMLRCVQASESGRRLRAGDKPMRIPALPKHTGACVACPIRIGGELVAVVWIMEGDHPLSELDHRAAEYAALVAAIHIAHQREIAAREAALGHASVLALLESEEDALDGPESASRLERVRLLGFDPTKRYRVGIVVVPEAESFAREGIARRDRVAECVREALKRNGAGALVSAVLNRVPFLLPEAASLEAVVSACRDARLSFVAGRAYSGAAGVRRSYREALSLLRYRNRPAVCRFDDVLVPRVIGGDRDARRTFVEDRIGPLLAQRGGSGLVAALVAFARSGFRLREGASALGIHANTLRYRLNRISETLGLQLGEPDVRFELQLLVRILELDEPELVFRLQNEK